jgi:carbon starvation protein CstA
VAGASVILWIAYRTHGAFLAKTVFRLDDSRTTPAVEMADGNDYVAIDPWILGKPAIHPAIPVVSLVLIVLAGLMAIETTLAIVRKRGHAPSAA